MATKPLNPGCIHDAIEYCRDWNKANPEQGNYALRGLMCGLQAMGLTYGQSLAAIAKEVVSGTDTTFNEKCVPWAWEYDLCKAIAEAEVERCRNL